jgi:hypothetical protein
MARRAQHGHEHHGEGHLTAEDDPVDVDGRVGHRARAGVRRAAAAIPPPARTRATGTSAVPPLWTGGPNTWSRPSRSAAVETMSGGVVDTVVGTVVYTVVYTVVGGVMAPSLPSSPAGGQAARVAAARLITRTTRRTPWRR